MCWFWELSVQGVVMETTTWSVIPQYSKALTNILVYNLNIPISDNMMYNWETWNFQTYSVHVNNNTCNFDYLESKPHKFIPHTETFILWTKSTMKSYRYNFIFVKFLLNFIVKLSTKLKTCYNEVLIHGMGLGCVWWDGGGICNPQPHPPFQPIPHQKSLRSHFWHITLHTPNYRSDLIYGRIISQNAPLHI